MIKSTFSILFIVRKSRLGKSGEAAITMRITVNGRYTELSTQRRGLPCGLRQTITDLHTASKRELPFGGDPYFYKRKIRIAVIYLGLQNALNISDNSSIYNYYGTNRVIIV